MKWFEGLLLAGVYMLVIAIACAALFHSVPTISTPPVVVEPDDDECDIDVDVEETNDCILRQNLVARANEETRARL